MISLYLIVALVCLLSIGLTSAHLRAHHLTACTWNELIARMQPIEFAGVRAVAMPHLDSGANRNARGPEEMWELLGGRKGLQRMNENARVMIALAAYAERQSNHEGMIIADRMRRDGLVLQRAVRSMYISGQFRAGILQSELQLRQVAESYYLMKQRLPALYEMSLPTVIPAW